MTKYTPATIAKALAAFFTAFGGAAATSAPFEGVGWAGAVGAGLVAGVAVFTVPNKPTEPPADTAIAAIQQTAAQARTATSDIGRIQAAVADAVDQTAVMGPLTRKVLSYVEAQGGS